MYLFHVLRIIFIFGFVPSVRFGMYLTNELFYVQQIIKLKIIQLMLLFMLIINMKVKMELSSMKPN